MYKEEDVRDRGRVEERGRASAEKEKFTIEYTRVKIGRNLLLDDLPAREEGKGYVSVADT